ncbi:MAG: hypothetical protein RL274_2797 [Pseudomonadota bacterium]|jgi:HK97 family phage major capsid protein
MLIDIPEDQRLALRKHGLPVLRALGVTNPDAFEAHKLPWRDLLGCRSAVFKEARALADKIKEGTSAADATSIEAAHSAVMLFIDEIESEKETRTALGNLSPRTHGGSHQRPIPSDNSGPAGAGLSGTLAEARGGLATFARSGDMEPLNQMAEHRAMTAGSDPSGGYFVIPTLSDSMTTRIFDENPMRRLSRVVSITSGDTFEEPLDMDEADASWVGEQSTRTKGDDPEVGKLIVPLHEIYALQTISQKLLDVSNYNLGAWLEAKISDKFGRTEGLAFVSGDANNRPRGFLALDTDTTADITRDEAKLQHVVSGGASTITADGLRNLYWAMRAGHRKNSTWLMASSTANAIDKLKDGNGDYLWRSGQTAGAPNSLLGLPVEFSEDMPAVEANAFPIALGDWQKGYTIVDQVGIRLLRDPFTDKPNVLFYAYKRVGGGVANTDAIKLLKIST